MGPEVTKGKVSLPEGTVIDARYRIVGLVETTYTGTVYAAEKIPSGEVVAMSFLDGNLLEDEADVARLRRDFEAVRNARHPNIAELIDLSIPPSGSSGLPYVVMELIVGLPLSETLKKGTKIDLLDALKIVRMVLDALSTLHKSFVAHRNLSPQSIILSVRPGEELQVKIIDFGLPVPMPARWIKEDGVARTEKPEAWDYAAPEYHKGGHVVARSDIFACGMMLMRMITGKLPERESEQGAGEKGPERAAAGDEEQTVSREGVESKEFPPAGTLNPVIPDDLDGIIAYALRKKAVERYGFASEMKEDLEKVLARLKSERTAEPPPWQKPDEILQYLDSLVGKVAPEIHLKGDLALRVDESGRVTAGDRRASGEYAGKPKRAGRVFLYLGLFLAVIAISAAAYVYLYQPELLGLAPEKDPLEALAPPLEPQDPETGNQIQAYPGGEAGAVNEQPTQGDPAQTGKTEEEVLAENLTPEAGQGSETGPSSEEAGAGAFEYKPVHVVVHVVPENAVVKIGSTVLKGDPPTANMVTRKWPVAIVAEAEGYQTFTKDIYLRKNRTFTLALNKLDTSEDPKKKKKKKKKGKKGGWLFVD
jgi:serine/threonine protein kinase